MANTNEDQPIELEDGAIEQAVGGKAALPKQAKPKGGTNADPEEGGE